MIISSPSDLKLEKALEHGKKHSKRMICFAPFGKEKATVLSRLCFPWVLDKSDYSVNHIIEIDRIDHEAIDSARKQLVLRSPKITMERFPSRKIRTYKQRKFGKPRPPPPVPPFNFPGIFQAWVVFRLSRFKRPQSCSAACSELLL